MQVWGDDLSSQLRKLQLEQELQEKVEEEEEQDEEEVPVEEELNKVQDNEVLDNVQKDKKEENDIKVGNSPFSISESSTCVKY